MSDQEKEATFTKDFVFQSGFKQEALQLVDEVIKQLHDQSDDVFKQAFLKDLEKFASAGMPLGNIGYAGKQMQALLRQETLKKAEVATQKAQEAQSFANTALDADADNIATKAALEAKSANASAVRIIESGIEEVKESQEKRLLDAYKFLIARVGWPFKETRRYDP